MFRLSLILHLFIGSALSGSAIIAVLVMGYDRLYPILFAAAAGVLLAIPISCLIARKLIQS